MNKTKEEPKKKEIKRAGVPIHGPFGILILFVCISIAYANYVVYFGTTGLIPKIMLIPSTLFVGLFLVIKATK